MISDMRKHFQSPLYKTAVWVSVIALAGVFSIPTLIKERNPNPWVIKVNNVEVGTKEFNWALAEKQEWLSMVRAQYGAQADFLLQAFGIKADPVSLAMESMIKESLLSDLALRTHINIHTQTIQTLLTDPGFIKYYLGSLIPAFALHTDGSINAAVLQNFLARKNMMPSEFEKQVESAVARKGVMDLFSIGAYVPLFDQNALAQASNCQRSFEVLTFSYDNQLHIEKKQALSEDEIERYYAIKKGGAAYRVPEKRSGVMWVFDSQDYDLEISESEVERYYQDHKAQLYVKSPKKVEVRRILIKDDHADALERINLVYQQVKDEPTLFDAKAREFSQDKESASRGGLISPFSRGEQDHVFERAAFLIKQDGDVSPVVKTRDGYEIIQRIRVIQPAYQELDQVYKAIEASLLQNKFLNQFATDCKNMKIKSKKDKIGIQEFVQEKNGTQRMISSGPEQDSIESKTLFGIKSLEGFDFCIDKDKGYIVQLTGIVKAYTADLSEVKDAVVQGLYHERTQESLKKIAQEALNASMQNPRLEAVKKVYGGQLMTTPLLLTDEIDKNESIKKLSLDASLFGVLEYVGLARSAVNEQGAHIIKVTQRVDSTLDHNETREEIGRIQQQRKRLMSESFVASLYRNATIKTNESMINLQKNYSL